jgi:hypothetical protein
MSKLVELFCDAYCLKENKPSLNLTDVELNSMIIA